MASNESIDIYAKPDETTTTIALNYTIPEENITKELKTIKILVNEKNLNAKNAMESRYIASPPNVETHMKNKRVNFPMASVEWIDDDVTRRNNHNEFYE